MIKVTTPATNVRQQGALSSLLEQYYRDKLAKLPPDKRQEFEDKIERASKEHQPDPMGGE